MSDFRQRFEITPLLLDFGTRVVALSQVARIEAGQQRPYRLTGAVLIAAAVAGLAVELARAGGLPPLGSGGSTGLWLAFLLAGVGIFALVFQRRALLIAISDGSRLTFTAARQEFLEEIVRRVAEALAAPMGSPLRYVVDLKAEAITAADGTSLALPAAPPPDPTAERIDPTPSLAPAAPEPAAGPATVEAFPPRDFEFSLASELEKAAAADRTSPRYVPTTMPLDRVAARGGGRAAAAALAVAAVPASAPMVAPLPAPDAAQDLDALIALVMRSPIQHKSTLLDLLRVVEDHIKGGRTEAEDAAAHWQSFSSYVHQYLTDVDGLGALTSRAGRRIEAVIER